MLNIRSAAISILPAIGLCFATAASASTIRVDQSDFLPGAGLITFSEFASGSTNPTYTPADYGGGSDAPTVNFGGFFNGQMLSTNPGSDCPGGAATGCVVGTPGGPLALDSSAPGTSITSDGAAPDSPVLSGSPRFNGPVGVLFSDPLVGVGLDGGFFDAVGTTQIEAFGTDGRVLGSVANTATGYNFLGLVTDDGTPQIGGLLFSLVADEPAGFGIDNLRFARAGEIVTPTDPGTDVPAPGMLGLFLFGFMGMALIAVSRRHG